MTKFYTAQIIQESVNETNRDLLEKWKAGNPVVRASFPKATTDQEAWQAIQEFGKRHAPESVWMNDTYQVQVRKCEPIGGSIPMVWLSIRRLNRGTIRDWREMQAIKNEIVGAECEGVELYPAESRLVDTANQYHMWVCTDERFRFPFGFMERMVSEESIGPSHNRPLPKER